MLEILSKVQPQSAVETFQYFLLVVLFAFAATMIPSLDDHTLEDHFRYLMTPVATIGGNLVFD